MLSKCPSPAIFAFFANLELCNRQLHTHKPGKNRHEIDVHWKEIMHFPAVSL